MDGIKTVGIVLFEDVELLDFTGPFEVFSAVRLDEERRREEPSPFRCVLVSEKGGMTLASGGMRVMADHSFADCPHLDIIVVPGGEGIRREQNNPAMLDWLRSRAPEVGKLTAVCTGSMLLGFAGLLAGRRATTHWEALDWMRESFPTTDVIADSRVVVDGALITSAGIAAGIDMALKVAEIYYGLDVAQHTARHMEYLPPEGLELKAV